MSGEVPFVYFEFLSSDAFTPTKRSSGSAGFELRSAHDVLIEPYDRDVVATDLRVHLPAACVGWVVPCNEKEAWDGLHVSADIIDAPSARQIRVTIWNHSDHLLEIQRGDHIAQVIFHKTTQPKVTLVPGTA
jgi:dUTP pyrophosphatase